VIELDAQLRRANYTPSTLACKAKSLRHILRWLWEYHGAPKLDDQVRRYPAPRPRNVTVKEDERAALIRTAPPHLKLWLLLCSDLAIRSGTALRLRPKHYDARRGTLTFTTKCDEHLTLPVTAEIRAMLAQCSQNTDQPFVCQLWETHNSKNHMPGKLGTFSATALTRSFRKLRSEAGIQRDIRPHDFRRTTAVAMLRKTQDIREVQAILGHKNLNSTLWYLDHDIRPISRATLEEIKQPTWREEHTA
jgi:integrase/recombinase XerC